MAAVEVEVFKNNNPFDHLATPEGVTALLETPIGRVTSEISDKSFLDVFHLITLTLGCSDGDIRRKRKLVIGKNVPEDVIQIQWEVDTRDHFFSIRAHNVREYDVRLYRSRYHAEHQKHGV